MRREATMEQEGHPSPEQLLVQLRALQEQLQDGRLSIREVQVSRWTRQALELAASLPGDSRAVPLWLEQLAEVLRLLAQLAAQKGLALAPPVAAGSAGDEGDGQAASGAAGAGAGAGADPEESPHGPRWALPDDGSPFGPNLVLDEARQRLQLLKEAARALASQAERFSRHQARPEQAVQELVQLLER
ncbi:MAG TPA: hypothetical protein VIL11_01435, partial [Limnochordales bacterium]